MGEVEVKQLERSIQAAAEICTALESPVSDEERMRLRRLAGQLANTLTAVLNKLPATGIGEQGAAQSGCH